MGRPGEPTISHNCRLLAQLKDGWATIDVYVNRIQMLTPRDAWAGSPCVNGSRRVARPTSPPLRRGVGHHGPFGPPATPLFQSRIPLPESPLVRQLGATHLPPAKCKNRLMARLRPNLSQPLLAPGGRQHGHIAGLLVPISSAKCRCDMSSSIRRKRNSAPFRVRGSLTRVRPIRRCRSRARVIGSPARCAAEGSWRWRSPPDRDGACAGTRSVAHHHQGPGLPGQGRPPGRAGHGCGLLGREHVSRRGQARSRAQEQDAGPGATEVHGELHRQDPRHPVGSRVALRYDALSAPRCSPNDRSRRRRQEAAHFLSSLDVSHLQGPSQGEGSSEDHSSIGSL